MSNKERALIYLLLLALALAISSADRSILKIEQIVKEDREIVNQLLEESVRVEELG